MKENNLYLSIFFLPYDKEKKRKSSIYFHLPIKITRLTWDIIN